jgi:hypothetical protein
LWGFLDGGLIFVMRGTIRPPMQFFPVKHTQFSGLIFSMLFEIRPDAALAACGGVLLAARHIARLKRATRSGGTLARLPRGPSALAARPCAHFADASKMDRSLIDPQSGH